jgi:hypothetical protein
MSRAGLITHHYCFYFWALGLSIGAPMTLPHSVHEPS